MTAAVVVGIGQLVAGDDAAGVLAARMLAPRGLEVRECADASIVLELVEAGRRVVLIDAVVGATPGAVLRLDPDALATGPAPLSSHGLGVAEAIELARMLYGIDRDAIAIVGIAIAPPTLGATGLSADVAAALAPAAQLAAELAAGAHRARESSSAAADAENTE